VTAVLALRGGRRRLEEVLRCRRASTGCGDEESDGVELLEGKDPRAIGSDRDAGGGELFFDLVDDVVWERRCSSPLAMAV
jgi:hypothetical protein